MLSTIGFTCLILYSILFHYSCGNAQSPMTDSTRAPRAGSTDELFNFDTKNRVVSQTVDADTIDKYKFVEVEVVRVVNPKLHAISFEVFYESTDRERVLLGTFSLFPADNPGTFIVATQGKVKDKGNLILSLTVPESARDDDALRVSTKRMKLREARSER